MMGEIPERRSVMNTGNSRLVLRDIPILNFALGLIFAAVGGLVVYQNGPILMLLFLAVGLGFLLFSSVLTITADRITRTLKLEYRSALRYSRKEVFFDEIAGISIQACRGSKGGSTFRVVLKRKDGELIPFRSSSSSGSGAKERIASKIRDFIGVPEFDSSPSGMVHAALAPYTGTFRETDGVHWIIQPIGSARWHSPDFKTPGLFLCISQKAEGQASGGFLATVGSMIFKKLLSSRFPPDDTPGLDQATALGPLEPTLERHFMAFSNDPAAARQMLNSKITIPLADWTNRYPVRQLQRSIFGPLTILFCPSGVYLSPMEPLQPNQVNELAALGTALVKSQRDSHDHSAF
jgi:hypothetical protein